MWILLAIGCVETAVNAIEYTDTWIQGERARGVDVLWVQDTSATMSEEQELLEEAATHFVAGLTFAVIDFRLGMVSTDVEADPPGTLLGPVLTDETPEMEEAFISLLTNAKEGSRNEQGIEAAMAAAHPSLTPDFARTDADLEIIFFSDEDDHGDVELTAILDALQEPRVDTELQVTAIVGDAPEGCASLAAAADPGFRYLSLQEATGGLRESICSPDYPRLLNRVGLSALGLVDHFFFSHFPDPNSLEVYVNEDLVEASGDQGWTYEIGDNSLRFHNEAIPGPAATVYATYKPFVGYRLDEDAD